MQIEDAHCHLQAYEPALLPEVLARARAAGVERFHCNGTRLADWPRVQECTAIPGVRASYGVHPWYVGQGSLPATLERLEQVLVQDPGAGLGEVGLDRLRGPTGALQSEWLEAQLAVAERLGRGVSLHSVGAQAETLALVKRLAPRVPSVLVHGFYGSVESAKALVAAGAHLGIGERLLGGCGAASPARQVRWEREAEKLRAVVRAVPRQAIVLETDCPFGRRKSPWWPSRSLPESLIELLTFIQPL